MNRTLLEVAAITAAAALYLFARADARRAADALPALPVRGASIAAAPRVDPAKPPSEEPEPILGRGTPESPYELPFSLFSFPDYDPPPLRPDPTPLAAAAFPPSLRPYDDKMVAVEGFLLATEFSGETLHRFMLSRYPAGCCFGGTPVLDEWIDVTLAQDGGRPPGAYSAQIRVVGTLDLGEATTQTGSVQSLYRLTNARFESVW